jgi:hypothetical protein
LAPVATNLVARCIFEMGILLAFFILKSPFFETFLYK